MASGGIVPGRLWSLPVPRPTQTPGLVGEERERPRIEGDAVLAPGVLDRDLFLEHVPAHALRIARERVAPAAGSRVDVAEDVAAMQRERALRGEGLRRRRAGIQEVSRRRPLASSLQPVRQMLPAVGAELERALGLLEAVLADQREAAAEPPGATGIGEITVALDADRVLGLDHLDGVVRKIHDRAAAGVDPVLRRPP